MFLAGPCECPAVASLVGPFMVGKQACAPRFVAESVRVSLGVPERADPADAVRVVRIGDSGETNIAGFTPQRLSGCSAQVRAALLTEGPHPTAGVDGAL